MSNELIELIAVGGPILVAVLGTLIGTFKKDQKTKRELGVISNKMVKETSKFVEAQHTNKNLDVKLTRMEDNLDRARLEIKDLIKDLKDDNDKLRKELGIKRD